MEASPSVLCRSKPTAYKCPAAPYEATLFTESHLRKHRVSQFTVDLYAAEQARRMALADVLTRTVHGCCARTAQLNRGFWSRRITSGLDVTGLLTYYPP